ncbi:hypothetical protein X743_17570 [Mesorhizobium sp. LNHC252B00]|nr:hypothetical protein X743_17570 [Mesorhizobium sp. LNHC252B00]
MRKLLKKQSHAPRVMITDKLGSYVKERGGESETGGKRIVDGNEPLKLAG